MKEIRPASPRVRLDPESYLVLHRQVLDRDIWRCQSCGSMQNLQSITSRIGAIQAVTLSKT